MFYEQTFYSLRPPTKTRVLLLKYVLRVMPRVDKWHVGNFNASMWAWHVDGKVGCDPLRVAICPVNTIPTWQNKGVHDEIAKGENWGRSVRHGAGTLVGARD